MTDKKAEHPIIMMAKILIVLSIFVIVFFIIFISFKEEMKDYERRVDFCKSKGFDRFTTRRDFLKPPRYYCYKLQDGFYNYSQEIK